MKTTRNIDRELLHHVYYNMENGNDWDLIDNDRLVELLTEVVSRLENIENTLEDLKAGPEWGDL